MVGITLVLAGGGMLSLFHALNPAQWSDVASISIADRWTDKETVLFGSLIAFLQSFSTIAIGLIVGLAGYRLASVHPSLSLRLATAAFLLAGFLSWIVFLSRSREGEEAPAETAGGSKREVVLSLAFAMFLSPCLEIEVFFFYAGISGLLAVAALAGLYFLVSIIAMLIALKTARGNSGRDKFRFLQRYEVFINGLILILSGIILFMHNQ